ncbi:MAG: hypothetical protein LC623_09895, partial [Halobacteriales archaeon]|nr:hypothetical protein [Halobacteriales archaeon]
MKPTHVSLILLLLFLTGALAGCAKAPVASDATSALPAHYAPRYGLGLNVSHVPPPGRFVENATDLDRLASFIWAWGPPTLRECGVNNTAGLQKLMEGRWYLGALNLIFDQCRDRHNDETQREAQEDEKRGVADKRIAAMLVEQSQTLNDTIQAFSARPWPTSATDLEVLGWVMRRVVWEESSFRSSFNLAANYTAHHTPNT